MPYNVGMSKDTILVFTLIGLVVFLFILGKVGGPALKPATTTATTQTSTSDRTIDINDVINDPPVYSDLTLTLPGRITDWVTKNTFVISPIQNGFGGGGRSLPLINKADFKLPDETPDDEIALGEVANIKVTGKIVIFDRATIEQEWGIDLDDKQVDRWNKTPVMLVDTIEKL